MTELEYLETINDRAQRIFDLAVNARDESQRVLDAAMALQNEMLRRKIELQRQELHWLDGTEV